MNLLRLLLSLFRSSLFAPLVEGRQVSIDILLAILTLGIRPAFSEREFGAHVFGFPLRRMLSLIQAVTHACLCFSVLRTARMILRSSSALMPSLCIDVTTTFFHLAQPFFSPHEVQCTNSIEFPTSHRYCDGAMLLRRDKGACGTGKLSAFKAAQRAHQRS